MDEREAERLALDAVHDAFAKYLAKIRREVFADPQRPDWAAWPVTAWPVFVGAVVVPALVAVFEETMRANGVTDELFISSASSSFVTQSLPPIVESSTIPDETYERLFTAVMGDLVAGAAIAGGILLASAPLWQPMLSVMAVNGAFAALNSGVFMAAKFASNGGRRRVTKTWRAVDDERTRPSHAAVDNTTIGVDDVFIVGGALMRYPHDPFGPVQEVANCRCGLTFGVGND